MNNNLTQKILQMKQKNLFHQELPQVDNGKDLEVGSHNQGGVGSAPSVVRKGKQQEADTWESRPKWALPHKSVKEIIGRKQLFDEERLLMIKLPPVLDLCIQYPIISKQHLMLRSKVLHRRQLEGCRWGLEPYDVIEVLQKPPHSEVKTAEHESRVRKHNQHYPLRQALSEVIVPNSAMLRRQSLVNVQERGYARLQDELMRAHKALERKDEEVDELRGIRERLMKEVSDFTAAIFEEVNSQLNEAALSEQLAKKQLKEANEKIEILTAEVTALKDLVLTSTPSSPNKHLHPQIDTMTKKEKGSTPFWKSHRRSTSHHQFTKESREMAEATEHHSLLKELDTVAFDEFTRWRLQPTMEFAGQFFTRVQQDDIQPCLNFRNTRLADRLLASVRQNTLSIEPIPGDQSFPRKCCLSESHKLCNYKIKFGGDEEWYSISRMSRNRIAAVCDFYAYLRYIVQGLVKCSDKDIFAELVRLRNQMAQARLGLI